MLEYAVSMMEQLMNTFIGPIGPEGRMRVLNALRRERGVEELPFIYKPTGKPHQAAEQYSRCMTILIEHAKKSLADEKAVDVIPDEFRILEVVMDEGCTPEADITA